MPDINIFLGIGQIIVPISVLGPPIFVELTKRRHDAVLYLIALAISLVQFFGYAVSLIVLLLLMGEVVNLIVTFIMLCLAMLTYILLTGSHVLEMIISPILKLTQGLRSP